MKRIVYTSLLHADTSAITILADEHLATEAELKSSGIAYTILRNGWYTENYTASVPAAVARADYADAAVAVLTSEGHDGKTYELAGG